MVGKEKKLGITVIQEKLINPRNAKCSDNFLHKTKIEAEKKFLETEWRYILWLLISLNIIIQAVISTGHHSGFAKPPMHGDYEAQRHWMEITINLPIKEWYFNTSDNNLNYWGLDYPPLTGYHSWLLGKISNWINPKWVELHASRGIEVPEHKLFMRISVILGMVSIYLPSVLCLSSLIYKKSNSDFKFVAAVLCYPGILFVDNGHFQYNHISLGLFLWAVYYFHRRRYSVGSIFYVMALNYKQMELYHALPIFVFLFSRSMAHQKGSIVGSLWQSFSNLFKLGIAVILTFIVIWLPFLTDFEVANQVLIRIFPLDRGIFEDKVANFWCSISVVVKIKELYAQKTLAQISALMVLAANLPSLWILFRRSNEKNFRVCLVVSSLAFYLFSFQVHEKSILLCTIPALFILNDYTDAILSFLSVSSFSMYHLAIKDGMPEILPLFIVYTLFLWTLNSNRNKFWQQYHILNLTASLVICALLLFGKPPTRYPHLFELLLAVYCFVQFSLLFLYLNVMLFYSNYFPAQMSKSKKE